MALPPLRHPFGRLSRPFMIIGRQRSITYKCFIDFNIHFESTCMTPKLLELLQDAFMYIIQSPIERSMSPNKPIIYSHLLTLMDNSPH